MVTSAEAASPIKVYVLHGSPTAAADKVERVDIDATNATTLASDSGNFTQPESIQIDFQNGFVFLMDSVGKQILRYDLNMTAGSRTVIYTVSHTGLPRGLAIDRDNQKLYFVTGSATSADDRLVRINYDGNGENTLVSGTAASSDLVVQPYGLAIDTERGYLYVGDIFSTQSQNLGIVRFNLDGTGRTQIVAENNAAFGGAVAIFEHMTVDESTGQLYFCTGSGTNSNDRVMRVNSDGTGLTTLYSGADFNQPVGVGIDKANGYIFVGDSGTAAAAPVAYRYNIDGSGGKTNFTTGAAINGVINNFAVYSPNAPTISDTTNQTITVGGSTGNLAVTVGDVETPAANLLVYAKSSNQTLVPNGNIAIGGSGANRTVNVTGAAGQTGTATITVTVNDGARITRDTFTVTASAPSNNADLSALSLSAGTISFSAATTAYSFNVANATTSTTVTATRADANATLQVQINGGGFTALNSGSASGPLSLNVGPNTVDVKVTAQDGTTTKTYTTTITRAAAATVSSLVRANATPTNATTVNWTLTLSAATTGATASNFSLSGTASSGASVGTPATGNGGLTWNVPVTTGSGSGTLILTMANSSGMSASVSNVPFQGETYTMDKTAPTVSMSSAAANPTNVSPIPVTVTFSEAVTGFVASDITAGNGTVSNFAGSGANYTFDLVPSGQGAVTANIAGGVCQDAVGNNNTAATQFSRTFDSSAPTVTISSTAPNPTNSSPIPVTVTFSEAVTGFTAADIATGNGTVNNLAGSGANYTFDLVPSGQGSVLVQIGANAAQDAAGNGNTAATQFSRTFDSSAPTVTVTSTAPNPTNTSPIPVTVTFSEAVTGFTAADIATGNGTVNNLAGSGANYTFDLVPSGQGSVLVQIGANAAQDAAGNGNTAATQFSRTFDSSAPTVTINQAAGQADPTATSPINFTVVFSEAVTGFTNSDVALSGAAGATTAVVTGGPSTYNVAVSGMTGNGTVIASVAVNAAKDAAGNNSAASTSTDNTVTYSATPAADVPVSISGGVVTIDGSGSSGAVNVILRLVNGAGGPFLEITDGTRTIGAGGGMTQVDTHTVRVPLASITSISISGSIQADSFFLDFNNGDFCPAGGINIAGGLPTTGPGDTLTVDGDFSSGGIYGPNGAGSGVLTLDSSNVITFSGLEPVDLSLVSQPGFTVNVDPDSLVAGNVTTTVTSVDGGVNTLVSFTGGLESVKLGVVNGPLTINGDNVDNDYFVLRGIGTAMTGDLIVDGKGGNADVIDIYNGTIALAAGKNLSLKADFIGLGMDNAGTGVGTINVSGNIILDADGDSSITSPPIWGTGGVWGTTIPSYFASSALFTQRGSIQMRGLISKTAGADATATLKARAGVGFMNVSTTAGMITSTSNKLNVIVQADSDANNDGSVQMQSVAAITSNGGNVTIGGGLDPATSPAVGVTGGGATAGVLLNNVAITTGGGNVSIRGKGFAGNNGFGVLIQAAAGANGNPVINTGSGNLSINGTGGGTTGAVSTCHGIQMLGVTGKLAQLLTTTGTTTLTGTATTGNNNGLVLLSHVEIAASGAGAVNLTATGTGTAVGLNVNPSSGTTAQVRSTGGDLTLAADMMSLESGAGNRFFQTSGAGIITVKPLSNGKAIALGAADSSSQLGISAFELGILTAGTVAIGDSNSGALTVSLVISPANFTTLALASGVGTTFSAASGFVADITSASNYEKITVTGNVSITAGAAFTANNPGSLLNDSDTLTFLDNDGAEAISGSFNNFPDGGIVANLFGTNRDGKINYAGGSGNDLTATFATPEIDVRGNSVSIASGDVTPSVTDDTDFGTVPVASGSVAHTFTIANIGSKDLTLSGSPRVEIGGTNAADFSVTATPSTPVTAGSSTTFQITFDPSASGLRTATVSIANNDTDENPYTFAIQGSGQAVAPIVAATNAAVTVNEVSTASNTGTFSGQAGNTITISASTGLVTQGAGTWSWSATTTDGPAGPDTVTITATDSTNNLSANTTFTVTVNNVAPTISLSGNASVVANVSYQLSFGGLTDPGADTVSGYTVSWGDGSPADNFGGSPANGNVSHTYTSTGSYVISATITDEDGTYNASNTVSVSVTDPQAYTVDLIGLRTDGQTTPVADFGSTTVGGSVQETLIIANPAGNPTLRVSSITLPAGFRLGSGSISGGSTSGGSSSGGSGSSFLPRNLSGGSSLFFDVFFEPTEPGTFSGNLVIHTDAAGSLADFSFAITGRTGEAAAPSDDYFFAGTKAITCDVLANDRSSLSGNLTITAVTQPASGGSTRILNGKIVFTPTVRVTAPITFNYTVTNGTAALTPQVTIYPLPLAGVYVGLLSDSSSAVKGRIDVTVNAAGSCTGTLRIDGARRPITGSLLNSSLIVYGFRTPGLLTLVPPAGYTTAEPTLAASIGAPVALTALTGTLERSPYDGAHPAPQAGRYTLLAKLPEGGTGPKIGAALTSTIAPNGTVTFVGNLGEGTAVNQGGALLSGGRLPFYFGLNKAGALTRLSGQVVFDRNAQPQVSGTLHWTLPAGFSPRLGAVNQDYSLLGAYYTPAATGANLFSPPGGQTTLTLAMPTISLTPKTFTYVLDGPIRRGNVQWVVQAGTTGRLGGYYLSLSTGIYYGFYLGPQNKHRDFFGVVLQGTDLNYGEGYTLDLNSVGASTLKPVNQPH